MVKRRCGQCNRTTVERIVQAQVYCDQCLFDEWLASLKAWHDLEKEAYAWQVQSETNLRALWCPLT